MSLEGNVAFIANHLRLMIAEEELKNLIAQHPELAKKEYDQVERRECAVYEKITNLKAVVVDLRKDMMKDLIGI